MNAFELSARLLQFFAVRDCGHLSNDEKGAIFADMLATLPVAKICASSAATRAIVQDKIERELSGGREAQAQEPEPQEAGENGEHGATTVREHFPAGYVEYTGGPRKDARIPRKRAARATAGLD